MLPNINSITILINFVIDRYFQDYYCLFIFSDILNGFNYFGAIPSVRIQLIDNEIDFELIFQNHGCEGIIIQTKHPETVIIDFETNIRLQAERFNRRKYLIFNLDNTTDTIKNIFELNELNYIIDLLVITYYYEKSSNLTNEPIEFFLLQTHQYIGLEDNNQPVLIDKWFVKNHSFLFNNNLYPDKINNQNGRIVRLSTITYAPYSVPIHENDTFIEFYGSELSTAIYYARQYNMTPVPVIKEDEFWGELYENYTGTGIMGNVLKDKADISFASLGSWEFSYTYLDYSVPTVRTGVTGLVPSPKLADGWLTPLFSYTNELWAAVGLVFVLIAISLSYLSYFYNHNKIMRDKYKPVNKSTFFSYLLISTDKIYKLFVIQGLSVQEMPSELCTKFIMILLFNFSLFLSSTYSSGFASIMTIPRYDNPIDTVNDLAESKLYWGATGDAWIQSIVEAEEPEYQAIVQHFVVASEEELEKNAITRKFGFAMERLPFRNYAVGDYVTKNVINDYRVMGMDIYWTQCPIMARKSSVILPSLDNFILRAFESGLISKWQDIAVDKFLDPYVQRVVKFPHKDNTIVKLKWTHIQGAFAALLLGCISSFIVFICEIFFYRSKSKNFTS